jgi:UDP-N-acetylglucosamine 2-epimerase (non-hydrolysing)
LKVISPLDYLSFLELETKARLILTDSGGGEEEACILGVPCVTLRDNTGRPETIKVGSNVLVGTDPNTITRSVQIMLNRKRRWKQPFGDGKSGRRIVQILRKRVQPLEPGLVTAQKARATLEPLFP